MLWPQGRGTGGPAVPILTFDGDTAIDCNQAHGHPDRLENIMFQLLKTFLIRQLVHLFATFFLQAFLFFIPHFISYKIYFPQNNLDV